MLEKARGLLCVTEVVMEHNWEYVKKVTLWQYDDLLKKLDLVLTYPIIRKAYNHSMPQAMDFARRLFENSDIDAGDFPAPMIATFGCLYKLGIQDWADLLDRVATRESCVAFVESNHLVFEDVIDVLKYLLRSAFPFYTATRELLDHNDPQEMDFYNILKKHSLMCSFDLLEDGDTNPKRSALAKQTGLPLGFVNRLVHRADIARLPFVRRKTILPVCGAGYDTLAKIAAADLARMEGDMESYFQRTQGKSWNDFKSVIVLRGLVTGAKALPELMQS